MRHVLTRPASTAYRATAQGLLAASEHETAASAVQVGDPDAITDEHGNPFTGAGNVIRMST
jgi:hypothetical protein